MVRYLLKMVSSANGVFFKWKSGIRMTGTTSEHTWKKKFIQNTLFTANLVTLSKRFLNYCTYFSRCSFMNISKQLISNFCFVNQLFPQQCFRKKKDKDRRQGQGLYAVDWGTELIQFMVAKAIFYPDDLKNRINWTRTIWRIGWIATGRY